MSTHRDIHFIIRDSQYGNFKAQPITPMNEHDDIVVLLTPIGDLTSLPREAPRHGTYHHNIIENEADRLFKAGDPRAVLNPFGRPHIGVKVNGVYYTGYFSAHYGTYPNGRRYVKLEHHAGPLARELSQAAYRKLTEWITELEPELTDDEVKFDLEWKQIHDEIDRHLIKIEEAKKAIQDHEHKITQLRARADALLDPKAR